VKDDDELRVGRHLDDHDSGGEEEEEEDSHEAD